MNRIDCLKLILETFPNNPIIFTTGYTCREAHAIQDRENNFYMVGSMGLASSIAAGLAYCVKESVVIVDGDGSVLMNPSGLFLSKILGIDNLIHIVLDNSTYDSTGGQITHSDKFDLCKMALLAGYKIVESASKADDFQLSLQYFLENKGPHFLRVHIVSGGTSQAPRISVPLPQLTNRFKEFVAGNLHGSWIV